jgi:glutamate racemase
MTQGISTRSPIGVFDSGVGGLSVLRAIHQIHPVEDLVYLADQIHVPYGMRPLEEVRTFAESITQYLLNQGAKMVVVACNTASAAALHYLRGIFPEVPFVGMEPAVKPAAETTQSGKVGVLATPATFQGALYASVVERFANGVTLLQHTCPGLVEQIENGQLKTDKTWAILEAALKPMLDQGIDTVVLGCTHYPFVIPIIQEIVGPEVRVIDPAPAIARQVGRLLKARGMLHSLTGKGGKSKTQLGSIRFATSGDPLKFKQLLPDLWGDDGQVQGLGWIEGRVVPV